MSNEVASYHVFGNDLLLNNILSFLDIHSLRRSQSVAKQWCEVTKQVIKRRRNFVQILRACISGRAGNPNSKLLNLHTNWDSIRCELEKKTKTESWHELEFGLLFHGPCSPRNSKAFATSDTFRRCLPPNSRYINVISSSGIIGWCDNDPKSAVEIQADVTSSAGMSYLLWSDIGIDVEIFGKCDSIDHLLPENGGRNLKGVIVLTRELYEDGGVKKFPAIEKLYEAYDSKLAVGGLVVRRISNLEGHGKAHQPDLKWIGIGLSGQHLKMASCVLESDNVEDLRTEMERFRSSLDFNVHGTDTDTKTVGILLACCGRGKNMFGDANAEVDVFASVFPGVRLTGSYGDGEFGMDYWPKGGNPVRSEEDWVEGSKWWHFYSSVLILMNVPIK